MAPVATQCARVVLTKYPLHYFKNPFFKSLIQCYLIIQFIHLLNECLCHYIFIMFLIGPAL